MTERWRLDVLAKPVDIAWLGVFRMLFGMTMCVSMLRCILYGWIDPFFVKPAFHFKYWGFGWIETLPAPLMHGLFWGLLVLSLLVALGLWFRLSTLLFVLGFAYLQLVDVTNYLNHYYLAGLLGLLLLVSPAAQWGSIDTWRHPARSRSQIPALWLYLFRFQVGVVYTFAGLAKAHGDWLLHAQPLRIWLGSQTDLPWIGPLFTLEGVPMLMSWAGFLFDTSIPWLLLIRRVRPFAYVAVIVFHVLTRTLFPIGMFAVIMVLSALVFFSPSWPRRLLALLPSRWVSRAAAAPALTAQVPARLPSWGVGLVALYCLFHVLMPLRFLAYGGDVRWHEQGMRFSWRVMVREKSGSVTFVVRQESTGRSWYVNPRVYLTRLQEREMAGQPDLVLQLAHHIRDDYQRRGFGSVEVHADVLVSLNGRRMKRMIDAEVDLAAVEDGLGRAAWILPAPREAPPHIRAL